MAKKKLLSRDENKLYLKVFKREFKKIKEKPILERAAYLLYLYEKNFSGLIIPESYKKARKRMVKYLFPVRISSEELEKLYIDEFAFIASLLSKKTCPSFFIRLLAANYLENLMGRSWQGFPAGNATLSDERIVDFGNQMISIYTSSSQSIQSEDSLPGLPEVELVHVLESPFFNEDLKLLMVKSADPDGRKKLLLKVRKNKLAINETKMNERSDLLIAYLVLVGMFKVYDQILLMNRSLPVQENRLFKLLVIFRNKRESENKILTELRAIMGAPSKASHE